MYNCVHDMQHIYSNSVLLLFVENILLRIYTIHFHITIHQWRQIIMANFQYKLIEARDIKC